MKYLLGIDAGATKTHFVLADEQGSQLARVQVGPSNLHDIAASAIARMFSQALTKVCKQATGKTRVALDGVAIGWAGLDSAHDLRTAHRIVKQAFNHSLPGARQIKIVNDTIIGLWSGSSAKNAICVIGGTGSNGYGRNAKGKEAWAGGLGHVLADEGSGYDAGMRILHAVAKSADGRGPKTILEKLVLKKFRVRTVRDLVKIVYAPSFGKSEVGQLAYLLEQATNEKDEVALGIGHACAAELAMIVKAVAEKLGFDKTTPFDVVTIGGFLKHDPIVGPSFTDQVGKLFPRISVITPAADPVEGAVRLAQSLI